MAVLLADVAVVLLKEESDLVVLLQAHGGVGRCGVAYLQRAVPVLCERCDVLPVVGVVELLVEDSDIAARASHGYRLECDVHFRSVLVAYGRYDEDFAVRAVAADGDTVVAASREGLRSPFAFGLFGVGEGVDVVVASRCAAGGDEDASVG